MSADDSIEIEFPSLKQSAPQLSEGVGSRRAPGPIEAQLTGSSGDDDLSWLSAIFADDEDDEDEDVGVDAGPDPASSDDTSSEHANGEPTMAPNGPIDDPLGDVLDGSANDFEDELIEHEDHDVTPVSGWLDAEDDLEDTAPGEGELRVDLDPTVEVGDPDPIDTESEPDDSQPSSPSKKVTGFREEIMSTFSQMYN